MSAGHLPPISPQTVAHAKRKDTHPVRDELSDGDRPRAVGKKVGLLDHDILRRLRAGACSEMRLCVNTTRSAYLVTCDHAEAPRTIPQREHRSIRLGDARVVEVGTISGALK